ncbi:MAG: TetR/AcrR family transcriptional regulator, partial [Trebonia sp.]
RRPPDADRTAHGRVGVMPRINAATVREHHELQREAILDAVGALLAEHGYEGVELAAVGQRVGLARTSIYRYARDRDQLVAQWLERAFGPAMAEARAVLGSPDPPVERLAAWLDAQLHFAARPRDGAAARLMAEFAHLPEPIQTRIIDGHRPLREALEATVTEALEDQPGREPDLVLALIDGIAAAVTRRAAGGVTAQLRAEARNAVRAVLQKNDS